MATSSAAPKTFQALVLHEVTDPPILKPTSLSLPVSASPGTITVRVLASPFLSYAKSVLNGARKYPLSLPMVPGLGAIVRVVAPLPPDATSMKEGQLCLVDPTIRARDEPENMMLLGNHGGATEQARRLMSDQWRNGTMAQFANVPVENVYPLEETLLCQGLGYSFQDLAYMSTLLVSIGGFIELDVKAGDRVVIAPATGSFGGAGVEVARALGADVIMAGRNGEQLEKMKNVMVAKNPGQGKVDVVVLTGEIEKDVAAISACGVVDKYLDFSPPQAAKSKHIVACLMALRRGGTACFQGGIVDAVEIPYALVMFNDLTIKGKFMYERGGVKRLIRLVEGGRLLLGEKGGIETVKTFGLSGWKEALDRAEQDAGWGKQVVLDPWRE